MSWGIIFLILFAIVILAVVGITIYLFLIKKYNIKQVYYMIKYRGDETALMKDMMKKFIVGKLESTENKPTLVLYKNEYDTWTLYNDKYTKLRTEDGKYIDDTPIKNDDLVYIKNTNEYKVKLE
jgi:hypothetical protein|tara:strand:- start:514 stop:885 length:372 start_codon:yes stop_codon:yes gene_type:complete